MFYYIMSNEKYTKHSPTRKDKKEDELREVSRRYQCSGALEHPHMSLLHSKTRVVKKPSLHAGGIDGDDKTRRQRAEANRRVVNYGVVLGVAVPMMT
ncbi:hypothetical protein KQX54_006365 [Cotesia glomerata]|uniref:Uncharacterized protein n=1 Tax=Cotesia glomerata TaxID=32391 RepID=A0AAV7HHQ4_COTGL|nr:hypothetical protein KQX54_006365 [Cotesia glomerata]